jgi:corrinoid protein of di/trimethylamine methyltransferase
MSNDVKKSEISSSAPDALTSVTQQTFSYNTPFSDEVRISKLHSHKRIEISMVVEGNGIHRILEQNVPCNVGDIYIVNSKVPHGYFSVDGGSTLTVRTLLFSPTEWFDGDIANPDDQHFCYGVFSENGAVAYAMLTHDVLDKIISICDDISWETERQKDRWCDAVRAHFSILFITLGRYINSAIKNIPDISATAWNAVSGIMAAVAENYGDHTLTLDTFAKLFYTNKSNLSRSFKQITGEYFSDYLRRVRLDHACSMLKDTDMKVEQIMKMCGMRDATSFYKVFGEYTGMTPNKYRKINKIGEKAMNILNEISENLQRGKAKVVKEYVQQAIDAGLDAETILTEGLLAGMSVIGERFKNNEIYVPEVLIAARAMNMGTQILKPLLAEGKMGEKGKVCIGTVQGDLHDIGKNLVKMMMEGKGLEVIDLGTDVSAETFVNTAIEQNCQVICCSALLTTTMSVMEDVVKAAEAAGIRDKVKIMVGGAPLNEEYCRKIGADCYTVDAASAADAAIELCKK